MYAILHYLYRDASNWKTFGAVAFPNPDAKTVEEITAAIRATLEGGEFFIAESVNLPTLYHDVSDPNWADQAHGYHEFGQVELADEPCSGIKRGERTIAELLEAFLAESKKNWPIVRDLETEFGGRGDLSISAKPPLPPTPYENEKSIPPKKEKNHDHHPDL